MYVCCSYESRLSDLADNHVEYAIETACLSIGLPVCLSVCLSLYLSVYRFCLFISASLQCSHFWYNIGIISITFQAITTRTNTHTHRERETYTQSFPFTIPFCIMRAHLMTSKLYIMAPNYKAFRLKLPPP